MYNFRLVDGNQSELFQTFDQFLDGHGKVCRRHYLDFLISWIVPVIFAVIIFVGVVGNSLVLFVVTFWQQMRNSTNVLILVSNPIVVFYYLQQGVL